MKAKAILFLLMIVIIFAVGILSFTALIPQSKVRKSKISNTYIIDSERNTNESKYTTLVLQNHPTFLQTSTSGMLF